LSVFVADQAADAWLRMSGSGTGPEILFLVLSAADPRAADLTVASLVRQGDGVGLVRILQQNPEMRFDEPADAIDADASDRVWIRRSQSMHNAALAEARTRAGDAGIAVFVREGVVIADGFVGSVRDAFASDPGLAGMVLALSRSTRINELSEQQLASDDPWSLLGRTFDSESEILKARYLRPCLVAMRVNGLTGAFEEFSSLSDWYAYRRFLAAASPGGRIKEEMSPLVGYIGSRPDRRAPYVQGVEAAKAIFHIGTAYPEFAHDARLDYRTALWSQFKGLSHTGRRQRAWGFLRGLLAQRAAEMTRRRKFVRDVSEIN